MSPENRLAKKAFKASHPDHSPPTDSQHNFDFRKKYRDFVAGKDIHPVGAGRVVSTTDTNYKRTFKALHGDRPAEAGHVQPKRPVEIPTPVRTTSPHRNTFRKIFAREERLDEVSATLLRTYHDRAVDDYADKASVAKQAASLKGEYVRKGDSLKAAAADRVSSRLRSKAEKRFAGIKTARRRLSENDLAANCVQGGNLQGLGGENGEPGVDKKKKKKTVLQAMRRR